MLFSALSLNVSAADGTEPIKASEMDLSVQVSYQGDTTSTDVTDDCVLQIWAGNSYTDFTGFFAIKIPSNIHQDTISQAILLSENFKVTADHEYELSFEYGSFLTYPYGVFAVVLVYYDSAGNEIRTDSLYVSSGIPSSPKSVNFSFKPNVSDIDGGYSCQLKFMFSNTGVQTSSMYYCISEEISLIDKDDDSGWFQKILNKINDVWESIKSLPDKIGAFIQNIATDIGEGLKELFIPSEGYFDEYAAKTKAWASEHFGFLYTASDLMLSLVSDLGDLLRDDYSFVLPAAEFDLNGEHYVLWDEYEVPVEQYIKDVPALNFAYSSYLTMLCGAFAFALFAYARQTYDKIMSN